MLDKAIKGAEVSIFVGLFAAAGDRHRHDPGGTFGLHRRQGRRLSRSGSTTFSSIPDILLIFAFAAVLGRGITTVILILGLVGWTGMYRLVRAEYIKHHNREYVQRGGSHRRQPLSRMFVHILPNVSHVVLVRMSLYVVGSSRPK